MIMCEILGILQPKNSLIRVYTFAIHVEACPDRELDLGS